jgi:hypothetical protein
MMKKTAVVLMLAMGLGTSMVSAQNLQVHYDFGEDRSYVTTTLEMFKPDQWGSTFFFVDFDYNTEVGNSVSMAYMEISRALKFWDSPFALQVEYNGGFGQFAPGLAYPINDAWLAGAQYTWNSADYSKIFTLQGLYKNIKDIESGSFQLTGVWTVQLLDGALTFNGFADFWKEGKVFNGKETDFVFLSEPQLWYNFGEHFSAGGEIELANNFIVEGFRVSPTLAVKWTF